MPSVLLVGGMTILSVARVRRSRFPVPGAPTEAPRPRPLDGQRRNCGWLSGQGGQDDLVWPDWKRYPVFVEVCLPSGVSGNGREESERSHDRAEWAKA